ncbi:hypothetical protein [Dyadobacter sp. NIV53]|uniref:hypothetical protein n=1 Tax=Dyadobacter sp. NIV53 TaxID=2861765 RepID=UPI001C882F8F|nr:hypothetical protein [Dyadobacter sp. NIV53]
MLGSAGLNSYADKEDNIKYDKNGNILTLKRYGNVVDNLIYSYLGNRLKAVNDGSTSNTGVKIGSSSYLYDTGGNMISDGNRGAALTYNYRSVGPAKFA